ncbi:MAG: ubiquinol oxidase subunit II [Sphingomonadales bacterium]|nr:MAG: ubiquinol oxidase subunit II [Sphingomonadales bacterium]
MLPLIALLGGCNMVVMSPSGDVAMQQKDLIIVSTILMLLIIVPVLIATGLFAWRYRASNKDAVYDPDWHHSTRLEVLIWTAPLMIIIALGAVTWISTHLLDPYRPLDRIDANRPVGDIKPITVEVVALPWKWMFIYPELGIATVNELAAPIDVPINFKITSSAIMNSFYIPALAGQIYAMAGMETKMHAVINKPGVYTGISANYSGAGFSGMNFKFHGLAQGDFDAWVEKVKTQGTALNRNAYLVLEKPSEKVPPRYFATVEQDLYQAILNMCAAPGKMCMDEMMRIDAQGGGGEDSTAVRERLMQGTHDFDSFGHSFSQGEEAIGATFPATNRSSKSSEQPEGMQDRPNATPPAGEPGAEAPTGQDQSMPGMDMPQTEGGQNPAPSQLDQ